MEQTNKPTYKVSPTLINSYRYYRENKSEKAFQELKDTIMHVFKTNKYIKRGIKFEDEVFAGQHGKLSELVKDLPSQKWGSVTLDFGDFNIRISGKLDAIDEAKKRIYDVKRVDKFSEDKYDNSVQHLYYLYLFPEIEHFYYLVASGKGDVVDGFHVIEKSRPDDLQKQVFDSITEFINFLKDNNLWELYTSTNEYKGKVNK